MVGRQSDMCPTFLGRLLGVPANEMRHMPPIESWRTTHATRVGALAVCLVTVSLLAPLCFMVMTGHMSALDIWAERAMPGWSCHFTAAGIALSALGYEYGTLPVSVLVPVMLALRKQWSQAAFLAFVLLGSLWLNQALKYLFDRVRPGWMPCIPEPGSHSFPSGHAMATASLVAGLLLLFPRLRRVAPATALILTGILIGVSRVTLGVHFPTDVIAGWCFGATWVCGSYVVISKDVRRSLI